MEDETRKRLRWVELFLQLGNYSVVCLKCGISQMGPALSSARDCWPVGLPDVKFD
jgi:hypothetical protein